MRIFAQVVDNKIHWIFQQTEEPAFAHNIKIIELTDLNPQPMEGWIYDNQMGAFIEPNQHAVTEVSKAQAKAALLNAGLLDDIEEYFNSGAVDRLMLIAWQDAQSFTRSSPFIASMQKVLNLDDSQVDDLFLEASRVQL